MSQANVQIVQDAFAVVTVPGDPEAIIAASDPGFEMHLVGVAGEPVAPAGASGIREWFHDVAQSWESLRLRPPSAATSAQACWSSVTCAAGGA